MSMIQVDPPESRLTQKAKQAGAGALVVVIGVIAAMVVIKTLLAALVGVAALVAIGAVIYLVFLRSDR